MKVVLCILAGMSLAIFPCLLASGNSQNPAPVQQTAGPPKEEGFVPLFNSKDLTGWHNVNCAPGTFYAKDGMIITTGVPTGYLRSAKPYENFILEFEWFHAPQNKGSVGNSGLFVWGDPLPAMGTGYTRSIEVQVLVNLEWTTKDKKRTATSQGDLFSIWGAKCKPDRPHPLGWERCIPSEDRAKGEFEWNHYRVEANNGVLKLAVNGKVVSGVSESNPRKGYLALESEGSECRFKNIKIKELPSTNPKPAECCDVDKGFLSMFTGINLAGWKGTDGQKSHWKTNDGVLIGDGNGKHEDVRLASEKSYGDFEMVFDCLSPGNSQNTTLQMRGVGQVSFGWPTKNGFSVSNKNGESVKDDKVALNPAGQWNRVLVRMKGDKISVRCNGKQAIEGFQIAGLDAGGPVAISNEGPIRLRNLFIRELKDGE